MSSVVISGDTSGAITLAAPAVAGTNTATLPAASGTVMVSGSMPVFSAYASTGTSMANNTFVQLQYQTKDFDSATAYNNTGSTATLNGISVPAYSFAPPVAGYYQVNAHFFGGGNSTYGIKLYKNGTAWAYGTQGSSMQVCNTSAVIYLNGTSDYVSVYAVQVTGGTITTLVNGADWNRFSACLVRTA